MDPLARSAGLPGGIDHLVYGCRDLELGKDRIEGLLGVRPVHGGRHPDYGTHNALVSLAPQTYLEVIAPDPGARTPRRGNPFGLGSVREPRLVTWALRVDAIAAAAAAGGLGGVEAGARRTPDGTRCRGSSRPVRDAAGRCGTVS